MPNKLNQRMQKNSFIHYESVLLILKRIGLFFLFLFPLLAFIPVEPFTDEADNFAGGISVAAGFDVYKHYYSQHMPLMYYFSALFRVLGAHSTATFRIGFFVITAIIWVLMYERYKGVVGKLTLLLYPIGYATVMSYFPGSSTTVISELLQSQGLIIIFLEYLLYNNNDRQASWITGIWISFGILISLGTAFVSVYAIFVVFVMFLITDVKALFLLNENIIRNSWQVVKKYSRILLLVLLPFAILVTYYKMTGNLYNFYYGAYKINRDIYSLYSGGFGTNIMQAPLEAIADWVNYISYGISQIKVDNILGYLAIIHVFINILFVLLCRYRYKLTISILALIFAIMGGIRPGYGFHDLPYFAITLFMFCFVVNELLIVRRSELYIQFFLLLIAAFLIIPYGNYFRNFSRLGDESKYSYSPYNQYAKLIDETTSSSDQIAITTVDYALYIEANRIPFSTGFDTPWMFEAFRGQSISNFEQNKPKVVIFDPDYEVWSYKQKDYFPMLNEMVNANYKQVEKNLYIRNDLLSEFYSKTGQLIPLFPACQPDGTVNPINETTTIQQPFKVLQQIDFSQISLLAGTYNRVNTSSIQLKVIESDTNKLIFSQSGIKVDKFIDNTYNDIDASGQLKSGTEYILEITAPTTDGIDQSITVYRTADQPDDLIEPAIVNGQRQDYDICFNLLHE